MFILGYWQLPRWPEITIGWFSPDVTAAMLVRKTMEKKIFWDFYSIIMQNMSHNLVVFCAPTRLSHV